MQNRITVTVLGLCMVLALAACGSSQQAEKKKLEDYQKVEQTASVYFSSFKKVNALTDISQLVLTRDAEPDEETERHTAETTAKIYSKNSTTSSVIGEFEDEDEVMVLEKITGTNWYKIVYNGRVAYVQATVLEVTSDSAGSYNNYIGYSDDAEDFDEAAAHAGEYVEPEEVENGTTAAHDEDESTDETETSSSASEADETTSGETSSDNSDDTDDDNTGDDNSDDTGGENSGDTNDDNSGDTGDDNSGDTGDDNSGESSGDNSGESSGDNSGDNSDDNAGGNNGSEG